MLGHDEHGHAGAATTGCSGVLVTDADDASHGGNVFGVIDATYTDLGDGSLPALTTQAQIQVRQQLQEVEFAVSRQGTNAAVTLDVGGGPQRGGLGNGDWTWLNGPFDLVNVSTSHSAHPEAAVPPGPVSSRSAWMPSTARS